MFPSASTPRPRNRSHRIAPVPKRPSVIVFCPIGQRIFDLSPVLRVLMPELLLRLLRFPDRRLCPTAGAAPHAKCVGLGAGMLLP